MKKYIFRFIEVVLFISILLLGVDRISLIKSSYCFEDNPGRSARLFFELPENTVDVAFLGDSHSFCAFIPQLIYDNQGISNASLATPAQFISNTYWLLKDMIKRQDFKVLVIEAHSIEHSFRGGFMEASFTSGLIMMPDFSINKLRGFYETKDIDMEYCSTIRLDSIYPLLQFNSDFGREGGSFTKLIDYMIRPGNYYKTLGFSPQTGVMALDSLSPGIEDDSVDLSDSVVIEYLERIYNLCKQNDIEILITRAPFNSSGAYAKIYEDIFRWARSKDINVLDFFEKFEEAGLDLSTDFRDSTHVNYNGAKKISNYLSTYLKDNYNLKDHRGDSRYYIWENNDYSYAETEKEMALNIEKSKK